jgi:hypothetical protein
MATNVKCHPTARAHTQRARARTHTHTYTHTHTHNAQAHSYPTTHSLQSQPLTQKHAQRIRRKKLTRNRQNCQEYRVFLMATNVKGPMPPTPHPSARTHTTRTRTYIYIFQFTPTHTLPPIPAIKTKAWTTDRDVRNLREIGQKNQEYRVFFSGYTRKMFPCTHKHMLPIYKI